MLELAGLVGLLLTVAAELVLVVRAVLARHIGDAADAQRLTLLATAMWIAIIAVSVLMKPGEPVIKRCAAGAGGLAAIICGARLRRT